MLANTFSHSTGPHRMIRQLHGSFCWMVRCSLPTMATQWPCLWSSSNDPYFCLSTRSSDTSARNFFPRRFYLQLSGAYISPITRLSNVSFFRAPSTFCSISLPDFMPTSFLPSLRTYFQLSNISLIYIYVQGLCCHLNHDNGHIILAMSPFFVIDDNTSKAIIKLNRK